MHWMCELLEIMAMRIVGSILAWRRIRGSVFSIRKSIILIGYTFHNLLNSTNTYFFKFRHVYGIILQLLISLKNKLTRNLLILQPPKRKILYNKPNQIQNPQILHFLLQTLTINKTETIPYLEYLCVFFLDVLLGLGFY
jgi:hypothetical protein